ncbi:hypothetical protein [Aquitalea sp. USM4]|uniref:hypothetical protein n=1 Tax=Aquitalea sp. USM4 TaxID=1590041 RepID=UPI00103A9B92|nr:hypothetical protein [Aquitalea sp. USM4]QBJ80551.1 hypothetical protein DKK66_20110 [Aquitalea sp. USM4]
MKSLIFLIEGGKALELIKAHIAQKKVVVAARKAMADELGISEGVTDVIDGRLLAVAFSGQRHPDFKAPDRKGMSYPKKRSEWEKRFAEAPACKDPVTVIGEELGVPTSISYTNAGGFGGWSSIGNPLRECGFLYLSENGPYAMWIPDIPSAVSSHEADGYQVKEPAKSFIPEFEGCRRIENEEWDIMVARHKLAKKMSAS